MTMKLKLGDIRISSIEKSSGFFWGNTNKLEKFHCRRIEKDVIGTITGNENILSEGHWIINKERKG